MFEEINIVKEIKETVEEVVAAAVTNKKNFDKKFLLTVVCYQREEEGLLVSALNSFYIIYSDAINYVASSDCELWFEEVYANSDENNFSDIKHFCGEYTKTKNAKHNMAYVRDLFDSIKENKLCRTVQLLTMVLNYNNFTEEYKNIINMVIEFINGLDK